MLRFVALAWETTSADQTLAVNVLRQRIGADLKLPKVLEVPGLSVFCTGFRPGSTTLQSIGERGILLGTVFRRSDLERQVAPGRTLISASESAAILADGGECL